MQDITDSLAEHAGMSEADKMKKLVQLLRDRHMPQQTPNARVVAGKWFELRVGTVPRYLCGTAFAVYHACERRKLEAATLLLDGATKSFCPHAILCSEQPAAAASQQPASQQPASQQPASQQPSIFCKINC